MAAMLREMHRGFVIFSACWTTGLAYGVAVLFYQAATWARHPFSSCLWMASIAMIFLSVIAIIYRYDTTSICNFFPSANKASSMRGNLEL